MKLRTKLFLAQSPLVAALAVSGAVGSNVTDHLGAASRGIIQDNYRSVLAAQRMNEAAERVNSGMLFLIAGEPERARAQIEAGRRVFATELQVEEQNITEPGERAVAQHLRAEWTAYLEVVQADAPLTKQDYFEHVLPRFMRVKAAAAAVLDMNQDAMVRKSDAAVRTSGKLRAALIAVAVIGCILAMFAAGWITTRMLRPLSILGQVARRIGEGDLKVRAVIDGNEELSALGEDLNTMADRLEAYRKSSLGELIEAQRASQAAIDSLPDPVLVLGLSGELQQSNHAADEIREDPKLREVLDKVRAHVLAGGGAYVPKGLDDAVPIRSSHYLPRAAPLYADEGAVIGTTIVLQDVTRLLRVDQLKNDLVATVAHELRTPLTSLRMAVHLCVEEAAGPLNAKQADLLGAAREDTERLQTIVDELLDLSRIQAGRLVLDLADADAEEMIRAAVEPYPNARAEVLPGLPKVKADRERIAIVLANLLSNAARHSPEGAVVRARALDGAVRFEVEDRGPGVPPEYRQAIFEKYFQMPGRPSGGAGLGLFIAKEIVAHHGGEIGVESAAGSGSTFWFELPVAP